MLVIKDLEPSFFKVDSQYPSRQELSHTDCLAIVFACKRFNQYLASREKFTSLKNLYSRSHCYQLLAVSKGCFSDFNDSTFQSVRNLNFRCSWATICLEQRSIKLISQTKLGVEARDTVFWQGMNAKVCDQIKQCSIWNELQVKNQKFPMQRHHLTDLPWSRVTADQFKLYGKEYLALVDFYSGFIKMKQLQDIKSSYVMNNSADMAFRIH